VFVEKFKTEFIRKYNGKMLLKTFNENYFGEIFLGYSDKHSGIMAQLYVFEN